MFMSGVQITSLSECFGPLVESQDPLPCYVGTAETELLRIWSIGAKGASQQWVSIERSDFLGSCHQNTSRCQTHLLPCLITWKHAA